MKKILFIITGSIACYKSVELIRILTKQNYNVTPLITKAASQFITPLLLTTISGNLAIDEMFDSNQEAKISHINLSRENDIIVIAPATADFINKIANGYGDDLASTVILASNKKIIIAPAMNEKMYYHPETIANISKLRERGVIIIDPESDILACNENGIGKMANIDKIIDEINIFNNINDDLKNKKIIISGGATFEAIDPVRFIGNYSSGKQAIAIAKELDNAGAEIIFVASNINMPINLSSDKIIRVRNSQEMHNAIIANLTNSFAFIGCAAVSDFVVKQYQPYKIKKQPNQNHLNLELVRNIDIIKDIANHKFRPNIVIGFAAEDVVDNIKDQDNDNQLLNYAKQKLINKNCDFIIANKIKQQDNNTIFSSEKTDAIIVGRNNFYKKIGLTSKRNIAIEISQLLCKEI